MGLTSGFPLVALGIFFLEDSLKACPGLLAPASKQTNQHLRAGDWERLGGRGRGVLSWEHGLWEG